MKKITKILISALILINISTAVKAYNLIVVTDNGDTLYCNAFTLDGTWNVDITRQSYDTTNYHSLSGAIVIPNSVTKDSIIYIVHGIDDFAFRYCKGITSVTFPTALWKMGVYAFDGCTNLKSVVNYPQINAVSMGCFRNCTHLNSFSFSSQSSIIDNYAFENCLVLSNINLPSSISIIGDGAFLNCTSLTSIILTEHMGTLGDGYLGDNAFKGCTNLNSVILSDSLTSIPNSCFEGCTSLQTISLPYHIKNIKNSAFKDCSSLNSINLDSIKYIGIHAFDGCVSLRNINLGENLYLGNFSFNNCIGLSKITDIDVNPTQLRDNTFTNVPKNIPVFVPCQSVTAYQNAQYWSEFTNFRCNNSGLEDQNQNDVLISLYPNPTKDFVNVNIDNLNSEVIVLTYDFKGRLLRKDTLNNGTKNLKIDVSTFERGIYLVKITDNNQNSIIKKLVVE